MQKWEFRTVMPRFDTEKNDEIFKELGELGFEPVFQYNIFNDIYLVFKRPLDNK